MASKYIYKFDIHDIFKASDEQKVLIGSFKDNSNEYVIINVLNDDRFLQQKVKERLKLLDNLVYFEELKEGIVLVTNFNKALYLTEYMKRNTLNIEDRLNLAYQYLKEITKYDDFSNDIKRILIEESQITIKEGNLLFNELLFIDEDSFNGEDSFKRVARDVVTVLKTILFTNPAFNKGKFNALGDIIEFINNLELGNHPYENLRDIFNDFNELYAISILNHSETHASEIINHHTGRRSGIKKKHNRGFVITTAGIVLLGLAIFVLVLRAGDKSKIIRDEFDEPIAYFEENQIEDNWRFINNSTVFGDTNELEEYLWEVTKENGISSQYSSENLTLILPDAGEYQISLKVKDKNNEWSKEYSKVIMMTGKDEDNSKLDEVRYSQESLEEYGVVYSSDSILVDKDTYRSGEYALKFIGTKDNLAKNISLSNVNTYKNSVLSLWIMSDTIEEIRMVFQGYENNDNLKFEKFIYHTPKVLGVWEMIYFDLPGEEITRIETTFFNSNATVWIDDIKIDSYK